jgi:prevent-host-death family protein
MAIQVNIGAAKTRLSELVAASQRGEEVYVAKAGKPIVKLVPVTPVDPAAQRAGQWREFYGSLKGQIPDIDWFEPMSKEDLALWYGPEDKS